MRFLVVLGAVGVMGATGAWAADPPKKITPVVVLTGTVSGQSKPTYGRCCTLDEWRTTWKAHRQGGWADGQDLPKIDFGSYMVLALFDGDGSDNYGFNVVEILDEPDGLRVRFEVPGYQTSVTGSEASEADRLKRATRSFAFIVVPRSDKAVQFERGFRTRTEGPPERWDKVGTAPKVPAK